MVQNFQKILLTVFLFKYAHGSYPFFGSCLNHSVVKDFNITRVSGIVYKIVYSFLKNS